MLRHSISRSLLLLLGASLLAACPDPGGDDGNDSANDSGAGSADETGEPVIDVPTDAMELAAWLAAESYAGWPSESAAHAATGTSPHGQVRTYFNNTLSASFEAGNTSHTVGSASVKELFDGMDTRVGWAVMVKVTAGDTADTWYWYLENSGSVTADGNGVGTCEGCHSPGTDRVLTEYPLQ